MNESGIIIIIILIISYGMVTREREVVCVELYATQYSE